jgi:quinol monooxygenase YgiN
MDGMVTVIAHIRAKPGRESRVRQVLEKLMVPTGAEAGCINYDLHQSLTDPTLFVFYENWKSEADLEAPARSVHMQSFRKLADEILAESVEITKWKAMP